jgi:hypothetical protein
MARPNSPYVPAAVAHVSVWVALHKAWLSEDVIRRLPEDDQVQLGRQYLACDNETIAGFTSSLRTNVIHLLTKVLPVFVTVPHKDHEHGKRMEVDDLIRWPYELRKTACDYCILRERSASATVFEKAVYSRFTHLGPVLWLPEALHDTCGDAVQTSSICRLASWEYGVLCSYYRRLKHWDLYDSQRDAIARLLLDEPRIFMPRPAEQHTLANENEIRAAIARAQDDPDTLQAYWRHLKLCVAEQHALAERKLASTAVAVIETHWEPRHADHTARARQSLRILADYDVR